MSDNQYQVILTDGSSLSSSGPLWVGTAIYLVLGLVALAGTYFAAQQRTIKPRSASLAYPMIVMATICLWMPWAITWLMQWHPILAPTPQKST